MPDRLQHQQEVQAFLQGHFSIADWRLTIPEGTGHETYFAHGDGHDYFVKLGVQTARYEEMAEMGLAPQVLADGSLEDGTSIVVQPLVEGRTPSRKDYRNHLEQFAATIDRTHHSPELRRVLSEVPSERYCVVASDRLAQIRQRWDRCKPQVPAEAAFVDESFDLLAQQAQGLSGTGLVASHNDICNANWLVTPQGRLYLIDLELMSLDDPAVDIGATLWWYYPPELRRRFLEIVGYAGDEPFRMRMRVRMAMHCLNIILPRDGSFDRFDAASFGESLTDFRAALAGKDNPQGYGD